MIKTKAKRYCIASGCTNNDRNSDHSFFCIPIHRKDAERTFRRGLQLVVWSLSVVVAKKCDQRPLMVTTQPLENEFFVMTVQNQGLDANGSFVPDQRYAISLYTKDSMRPFTAFMITVEDPRIDSMDYDVEQNPVDVGQLKTLVNDQRSQYSERCHNSVENIDNSEKDRLEIHWLSPKANLLNPKSIAEKVRIRAMVAENSEVWYTAPNLDVTLERDNSKAIDTPKYEAQETCKLCSEARYEIIFKGQWSRLTHPQHFPNKLDNNAYSHMVGASHSYRYVMWQPTDMASPGLQAAAETSNITKLEDEIVQAMSSTRKDSTRTLIKGQKNAHPNMFNPSHALFRVDRLHHLFSVVIAIRPSPDWFLGAYRFELCSEEGWLDNYVLPLYPWDAGTMDGVSYETPTKLSRPQVAVARVALGSFDRESPFFQINLNDLKPFGHLQINLLDEYPLHTAECAENNFAEDAEGNKKEQENGEVASLEEPEGEGGPQTSESREGCGFSEWSSWSPCEADGPCGAGHRFRTRLRMQWNPNYKGRGYSTSSNDEMCIVDQNKKDSEFQDCYSDCY